MQQADISKVRASVHQQCGSKVMIQLDRGRNKVDIQQGVIQHAYPSVFTILVMMSVMTINLSYYPLVIMILLQKIFA